MEEEQTEIKGGSYYNRRDIVISVDKAAYDTFVVEEDNEKRFVVRLKSTKREREEELLTPGNMAVFGDGFLIQHPPVDTIEMPPDDGTMVEGKGALSPNWLMT